MESKVISRGKGVFQTEGTACAKALWGEEERKQHCKEWEGTWCGSGLPR